jgi:hypothetical protein
MKKIPVLAQVTVILVLLFLSDLVLAEVGDGSILLGILFWAGIGQGLIALAAAADLSGGKWIKEIRPYLQEYYPLLILFPAAFLVFARHITVYHWAIYQPNGWLTPTFFILRNTVLLTMPFIFAHFYVEASRKESPGTGLFAVLYLVFFTISQSFMAFDLVMTFEYPWINTLFGGYFFVEALYGGIAFAAILSGLMMRRRPQRFKAAFRDFTLMIMGFALLWAGLFYSQYLVIWYGNLPEEVSYISKRMASPLLENMGIYILFALFILPFVLLVSRKIKSLVPAVTMIALLVFSGLMVERLIYLIPAAHMSAAAAVPAVLLGIPYIYLMFRQHQLFSHSSPDPL